MHSLQVHETPDSVRITSPHWEAQHLRDAGGAWNSLTFSNGSRKNLLRGPVTSALRLHAGEHGHGYYAEANDHAPRMLVHESHDAVTVISEGTYRNVEGSPIPVGFRRTTEYRARGLIWTTLQMMSDCGCGGVVELRGLDIPLRTGLTDAVVRFHPSQAGSADLLGGRSWIDLQNNQNASAFLSRFTPLQMSCFDRGVEGLEIFPGSDLAQWDCALKPDIGLGLYRIGHESGPSMEWAPYCLSARRMKTRLQGTLTLRLGLALTETKTQKKSSPSHAFISNPDTSDAQIELLAAQGVDLICFKDDCRDSGTFWRNGAVTPYNSAGISALRRLIDSCQRCSIKIVPYISTHELHRETHAYETNARAWMHSAARSLDVIHNWIGNAESGALMCLKSGWLDYRKQSIDAILRELPWDGVCLDWPAPLPCCHTGHAAGPFHSDTEELIDLMLYCRHRAETFALLSSTYASVLAVNLADRILVLDS